MVVAASVLAVVVMAVVWAWLSENRFVRQRQPRLPPGLGTTTPGS